MKRKHRIMNPETLVRTNPEGTSSQPPYKFFLSKMRLDPEGNKLNEDERF